MKESGKEKLIELLNEYIEEKELGNTVKEIDDDYFVNNYNNWDGYLCEQVISKKFGFIKWLVDNDKIDTRELENYIYFHNDYKFVANRELRDKFPNEIYVDHLLMLLATQDNPIEFLVGILK